MRKVFRIVKNLVVATIIIVIIYINIIIYRNMNRINMILFDIMILLKVTEYWGVRDIMNIYEFL